MSGKQKCRKKTDKMSVPAKVRGELKEQQTGTKTGGRKGSQNEREKRGKKETERRGATKRDGAKEKEMMKREGSRREEH